MRKSTTSEWKAALDATVSIASRPSQRSEAAPQLTTLQQWRQRCRQILNTQSFDTVIGLVIVANCFTIGLDQSSRLEDDAKNSAELELAENIFLGIYVFELGMRFFGIGWRCIRDHWVKFDCILVLSSLIFGWLFNFLQMEQDDGTGPLMVLRTIRLARLARTIRLLIKFRVLWMLVRGLLSSAETMFYTLTVLLIMLYVFATIGIELVTLRMQQDIEGEVQVDDEFEDVVNKHFASLADTMLTVMQFACLDSIGAIYRPLIEKDITLALYFLAIILIIPIVLMNLVTAIIVNSAMEQASNDKQAQKVEEEKRKASLLKKAAEVFRGLDEDGSNTVSRAEMSHISHAEKELLCEMCGAEDPLAIFDSLDVDGSGELDIDEFCDGIWKAAISKTPIEMQRMEKQIKVICDRQRQAEKRQEDIYISMRSVHQGLQRLEEFMDGPDHAGLAKSAGSTDVDDEVHTSSKVADGNDMSPVTAMLNRKIFAEDRPRQLSGQSKKKKSLRASSKGSKGSNRSQRSMKEVCEENERLRQELAATKAALGQAQCVGDARAQDRLPLAQDTDEGDEALVRAGTGRASPVHRSRMLVVDPADTEESRRVSL